MKKRPWQPQENFRYLLFFKPFQVLCQFSASENKKTLKDFIEIPDVYSVGRLDYDSEGLLLLTNDNRLNHLLSDPKHHQPKTYLVQVEGIPSEEELDKLRNGVLIQEVKTLPARAERIEEEPAFIYPRNPPIRTRASIPASWLALTLKEGRNRQVRHMTAAIGHPTLRLLRLSIGPLSLGELRPGEHRPLSTGELKSLQNIKGFSE